MRKFVRLSVLASVVAFLSDGAHDALVIPEVRATAWAIRYGVFGPIGLLVAFAFKNTRRCVGTSPRCCSSGSA